MIPIAFLWTALARAEAGADVLPLGLAAALAEAAAVNPEVLAARREAEAAAAGVWMAASPAMAMVEGARERDAGMASTNLTARLDLPFPGTSLFTGRAASAAAAAKAARARGVELEILARVRIAHARLWGADDGVATATAGRDLMAQAAVIAQARVAGGKAGTEELLMAQAEASRMGVMLRMARNERDLAEADLAALLHRPAGRDRFGPVTAPDLPDPSLDRDALLATARTDSPGALEAVHEARSAGAGAHAAALGILPRISPFLTTKRYDGGGTGTMAGLGLSYPLFFWAPAAEAKAARRMAQAARARAASAADEAARMAAGEASEWQAHAAAAREYRTVTLPLLAQAVRAARASYEAGRGDFLRLLAAGRDEVAGRREYAGEVVQTVEHQARLGAILGGAMEGKK